MNFHAFGGAQVRAAGCCLPVYLGVGSSGRRRHDARTGDPNAGHSGLPHWPTYEPTRRATMIFNVKSRIENDPFSEFRKLLPPLRCELAVGTHEHCDPHADDQQPDRAVKRQVPVACHVHDLAKHGR
jgi:hypothetical protein